MSNIYIFAWLFVLAIACIVIEIVIRKTYPLSEGKDASNLDPDGVSIASSNNYNLNQKMKRTKQRFYFFGGCGLLLIMLLIEHF